MAQPLLGCFQPFFDWLDRTTGGWDNLLQGAVGSILAVLVAVWIFRRESDEARRRAAEAFEDAARQARVNSAGQAAGTVLTSLAHLEDALNRVRALDPEGPLGRHFEAWEGHSRRLLHDVTVLGPLLPSPLEDQLIELSAKSSDAFYSDWGDGQLLQVELGSDEDLSAIAQGITTTRASLQEYRRHPTDPAGAAATDPAS